MSRNFERIAAAGSMAHTDHGMSLLMFREVVNGNIQDYKIQRVMDWIHESASTAFVESRGPAYLSI